MLQEGRVAVRNRGDHEAQFGASTHDGIRSGCFERLLSALRRRLVALAPLFFCIAIGHRISLLPLNVSEASALWTDLRFGIVNKSLAVTVFTNYHIISGRVEYLGPHFLSSHKDLNLFGALD